MVVNETNTAITTDEPVLRKPPLRNAVILRDFTNTETRNSTEATTEVDPHKDTNDDGGDDDLNFVNVLYALVGVSVFCTVCYVLYKRSRLLSGYFLVRNLEMSA